MFYRLVKAVIGLALRLFYRVRLEGGAGAVDGPVIFIANHPNSLVDPALLFAFLDRQLTFLAKAPLFQAPVFGWVLRGLGALPVYRRQDDATQMRNNEGTFEAASGALLQGKAISLFPEGKSHSEPQLAEIKTGCARIALRAFGRGAPVRIVPVGLTYSDRQRFRSEVLIEVGAPIEVVAPTSTVSEEDAEAVRALTGRIADALRQLTLNLERWEDLALVKTAEELYALRLGERPREPERMRRFAEGIQLLRAEQPERFDRIREDLVSFRRRLALVNAAPGDLELQYRRSEVYRFILRNVAALAFGFPLFALGCALFGVPFWIVRIASRLIRVEPDRVGTLKLVSALIMAPAWLTAMGVVAWWRGGTGWAVVTIAGALPLALFTRYFFERRRSAVRDALAFFILGNRARLKARLLVEGERLTDMIEALVDELGPRVGARVDRLSAGGSPHPH